MLILLVHLSGALPLLRLPLEPRDQSKREGELMEGVEATHLFQIQEDYADFVINDQGDFPGYSYYYVETGDVGSAELGSGVVGGEYEESGELENVNETGSGVEDDFSGWGSQVCPGSLQECLAACAPVKAIRELAFTLCNAECRDRCSP